MPVTQADQALCEAPGPSFTVAATNQRQGWIWTLVEQLISWGQVAEMDDCAAWLPCMLPC
jgi:hypothetical protein